MSEATGDASLDLVESEFERANIFATVSIRRFPGESIIIVEVAEADLPKAIDIANGLDSRIADGFITVRRMAQEPIKSAVSKPASLSDPRINDLVELLTSRSRTSEQQPSLRYVLDAAQTLTVAASQRHHLIFGRRGVGKTALMLEAKRTAESRGATTFWLNIQTMRDLDAAGAFLTTAARLCDLPLTTFASRGKQPLSVERASALRKRIDAQLALPSVELAAVSRLIPDLQQLMHLFCQETGQAVYLFMDELHYLKVVVQPVFLDMVHAVTRDTATWIKVAGIRHQSRWFTDNPPTGLQQGHDATIISLDVTLEQPAKAKSFLLSILQSYTMEVNLGNVRAAISREALDRLVLASGGVPRDFLILSAEAIQFAKRRANARTAGVQDVNEAAGRIAQTKLQELADDAASSAGSAAARRDALNVLRKFLLEDKKITFFRVDFRDKERNPEQYDLLQSLMDLRMIHLINGSLSDEREAGRRSEVYMLDLSQFSGTRFMRGVRVLELTNQSLVFKRTGDKAPPRAGDSPKRMLSILRRGPVFELSALTTFIAAS